MQNVFIRKRGNKHVVTLEYRDKQSGKRKQKALGSYDKKKEAEDALIEEKSKIINGNFIIPEKITFEQYLKQWLEQHKNNLSVTTYTRYKYIIDKQISPDIGEIELQKLTPLHLENFYYSMLKTLNPKTVLQYHRVIHKALNKAYKLQIINKNISNLVELPKIKKYKAKSLTIKEVKQFLEVSKDTRVEIPINLAIVLGLRAAEILGLSWDNVNFCENTIVICKTLVKDKINKTLVFKEPKSETSIRTLTVPEQLMSLLKEHKKKQKQLQLKSYGAFKNEFNLVFTKLNGNPMASDSLSSIFRDFINRNNLPNIRFHDLRHTNATLMLASGTSMKVASTRLGHSTIGITMDLYTHVLQGLEKEAAKNISDLIY
ncbi:recombinase [Clostridium sporogenes]|uniref:site-specific integrase n=1 Tax=Clostridium sporogenes TaxID=1509 RepID=UPI000780197E|nr:site-specific integrase [Clostridium sporogenes]KYN77137.1 recombinase [Clostridium sporogenes]